MPRTDVSPQNLIVKEVVLQYLLGVLIIITCTLIEQTRLTLNELYTYYVIFENGSLISKHKHFGSNASNTYKHRGIEKASEARILITFQVLQNLSSR